MQFPYVTTVAPNNSQKCGKWQYLSANQAIFQIQGDKTQEMYNTLCLSKGIDLKQDLVGLFHL